MILIPTSYNRKNKGTGLVRGWSFVNHIWNDF